MYKTIILFFLFQIILSAQYNDDMNRFMLAQNFEQAGDIEKAKNIYEDLYKRHSDNPQFFEALNRSYIGLKNYDGSISIIQSKLKLEPENVNLYGMLGSAYYLKGDENSAYAAWEEGTRKTPSNPMSYKVIANYAIERRVFEKAIEYLKKGKEVNQNPLMFSYDLANLYTITMQFSNAASEYIELLEKDPSQYPMIQQRILSYVNKPEALKSTIEVFEDKRPKNSTAASQILAQLYLQSKEFEKGFDLYKDIDKKQNSNGIELFNYAQSLVQQGEYKTSSEIFVYLLKEFPSSPIIPSVRLGYAKTLEAELKNSFSNEGWKTYSIAPSADPNEIKKIVASFEEIIKTFPNSEEAFEAQYRIGHIYKELLHNDKDAEAIFTKLRDNAPVSFYSTLAEEDLADIYLEQGNLKQSMELYNSIINSNRLKGKDLNNARYIVSKIYFYSGDFENAKNQLNGLITEFKDDISNDAIGLSLILNTMTNDSLNLLKFAEAEFLVEQNKFSNAREIYKILAENKDLLLLAGLAKFKMGEMDVALDNYDSSIKIFSEIGEEKEKNIYSDKALYLLGKIYQFAKKDKNKAIVIYERLLAEFPQSIYLDEVREEINVLKKIS